MQPKLFEKLIDWPKCFITGVDLAAILDKSYDSRHAIIKRAVKNDFLIRIQNDLYLISKPIKKELPNAFEIAQLIWGPSYISFESALSFHGWIPETAYTTTSACCKKGKTVTTPIGTFDFKHVPIDAFPMGLHFQQEENASFMIAQPWKAVADIIYSNKIRWPDVTALSSDLRIEWEVLTTSDLSLLKYLAENYPSPRTKQTLGQYYQELHKQ